MLATKTTAPTQRTTWSATALQIIAIMFVMTAMVGNWLHQLKVPRPDAYDMDAEFREWLIDFGHCGYVVLYRMRARRL